jgi:hypothetical protein
MSITTPITTFWRHLSDLLELQTESLKYEDTMKSVRLLSFYSAAVLLFVTSNAALAQVTSQRDISLAGLNVTNPCIPGDNVSVLGSAHVNEVVNGQVASINVNFSNATAKDNKAGSVYSTTSAFTENGPIPSQSNYLEKIQFVGSAGQKGFTLPLSITIKYSSGGADLVNESIGSPVCDSTAANTASPSPTSPTDGNPVTTSPTESPTSPTDGNPVTTSPTESPTSPTDGNPLTTSPNSGRRHRTTSPNSGRHRTTSPNTGRHRTT